MTRQWSRGEKWLMFGSAAACLLALIPAWIYQHQNELPPPPVVVEEVPPQNNAFDLILQAVAVAPRLPYAISTQNGCKSSNVDREYACDNSISTPLPYTPQYNVAFPLKQKIPFLKSAQNSLKLWRDSLSLPLYVPPTMSTTQERLWGHRHYLLRMASVQTHACWQRGDNKGALDWLLNWHREFCRATGYFSYMQRSTMFMDLLANSEKQRASMFSEVERLSPYLNASQSRHAALELQKNRSLLSSRVGALTKAKSIALQRAYRVCQGQPDPYREFPTAGLKALKFRWTNKKAGLARIKRQWDWLIEQEKLPLSEQFSANNELPSDVYMEDDDPFWNLSFGNRPMIIEHRDSLQVNAREVVWETAMAVRAFAFDHGHNPDNLNDLVPHYLQRVENDPYDSSHQLLYSPLPKTYIQWYKGKEIYTKKLPSDAIAAPQSVYSSGTLSLRSKRQPTGYLLMNKCQRLPFLLYSVGDNGRDDGGIDLKAISTKPVARLEQPAVGTLSSNPIFMRCDDILAPVEWFMIAQIPPSAKINPVPLGP